MIGWNTYFESIKSSDVVDQLRIEGDVIVLFKLVLVLVRHILYLGIPWYVFKNYKIALKSVLINGSGILIENGLQFHYRISILRHRQSNSFNAISYIINELTSH